MNMWKDVIKNLQGVSAEVKLELHPITMIIFIHVFNLYTMI